MLGTPQVYFIHHIINIGLANMAVSLTGNAVCLEGLLVALMSCVEGVEVMGESTLVQQWVCTGIFWCVVLSSFQI